MKVCYFVYREDNVMVYASQVLEYLQQLKEKPSVEEIGLIVFRHEKNLFKKDKVEKDPVVLDLEHRLSEKLATQVEIGKNKMTIAFHDTKDLNRILEILDCLDKGI